MARFALLASTLGIVLEDRAKLIAVLQGTGRTQLVFGAAFSLGLWLTA